MNNLILSEETAVSPSEIFMDGQSMTEIDLESTRHAIVERLHETSDITEISQAIVNLNGVEVFAAKAKSKLVFGFSQWFKEVNPDGSFAEWYVQKFGGEKLSVQKHQAIGELLLDASVPDNVKLLPSKELVSVARAKQSGYELDEVWDEIASAGSEGEVNSIVRRVKGKPERVGTLNIKVYKDGTIMGFRNGVVVNGGWLNFADRDGDSLSDEEKEVLATLISRIINNSKIKED